MTPPKNTQECEMEKGGYTCPNACCSPSTEDWSEHAQELENAFIDVYHTAKEELKTELIEKLEKLIPEDTEAKGWELIENVESCCPGDDAGYGYEKALEDAIALIKEIC